SGSIGRADSESDHRSYISENRGENHGIDCAQILRGHGYRHSVLPQLSEHVCQGMSGKELKLVKHNEEVSTVALLYISSAKTGERQMRQQHRADEDGGVL